MYPTGNEAIENFTYYIKKKKESSNKYEKSIDEMTFLFANLLL